MRLSIGELPKKSETPIEKAKVTQNSGKVSVDRKTELGTLDHAASLDKVRDYLTSALIR